MSLTPELLRDFSLKSIFQMAVSPSQATRILTSPRTQAKLPETKAAPDAVLSFFPPTAIKRITNVNVRDDFNPFKLKVPDPKSVCEFARIPNQG